MTIVEALAEQERTRREKVALLARREGGTVAVTWGELARRAWAVANGLRGVGIQKGERVALLSGNRLEWAFCDLGILAAGAVTVPVYPTLPAQQVAHVLADAQASAVVVEDAAQWHKIRQARGALPKLRCAIAIEPIAGDPGADAPLPLGGLLAGPPTPPLATPEPDDPATFIYTSGTTGPPKGAVLAHRNITAIAESIRRLFGREVRSDHDLNLLVLPLAHLLPRVGALFHPVFAGVPVAFGTADSLAQDLLAFRPTYFIAVPRILEKMHARLVAGVETASPLRRRVFSWAAGVGRHVSRCRQSRRPVPLALGLQHRVADCLVYRPLRARLGGRLRFALSGGAPLPVNVAELLDAMGLRILEFYGLTESVGGTVTSFDDYRFGTVGRPMPGFEVRLTEDGEILIRGNNVAGYHGNPAATAEAIDSEGWLHTGDVGELDALGRLRITDRKKDLIVTAGGKKVAPQTIENLLRGDPLISQAVLHGDRRPYVVALLTLERDRAMAYAREQGLAPESPYAALARHPTMYERVNRTVQAVNAGLARHEQVQYFTILDHELTIEDGSLTPTLKVKRQLVAERYWTLLDAMYPPS